MPFISPRCLIGKTGEGVFTPARFAAALHAHLLSVSAKTNRHALRIIVRFSDFRIWKVGVWRRVRGRLLLQLVERLPNLGDYLHEPISLLVRQRNALVQ